MLNLDFPETVTEETTLPAMDQYGVSGGVAVSGKLTGAIYLNFSHNLAKGVANRILGDDPGRSNEEIDDVVAEITNMVTGSFKSKLTNSGIPCTLGVPTVTRGLKIDVAALQPGLTLSDSFIVPELNETLNFCILVH